MVKSRRRHFHNAPQTLHKRKHTNDTHTHTHTQRRGHTHTHLHLHRHTHTHTHTDNSRCMHFLTCCPNLLKTLISLQISRNLGANQDFSFFQEKYRADLFWVYCLGKFQTFFCSPSVWCLFILEPFLFFGKCPGIIKKNENN